MIASLERPTVKELDKKIRTAREVFSRDGYRPANPAKLAADFSKLRLFDLNRQTGAIAAVLSEIGAKYYCGSHPPDQSYEDSTKNADLAGNWKPT